MANVLVTGCAQKTAERLRWAGDTVYEVDKVSYTNQGVDDLRIVNLLQMNKIDTVIHLAAYAYVDITYSPMTFMKTNVNASIRFMDNIICAGTVECVLFPSAETDNSELRTDPYLATRLMIELAIASLCTTYHIGYIKLLKGDEVHKKGERWVTK